MCGRCAGDYFTYALVGGVPTCGCKGSDGKLTVRASAQAMMFKISGLVMSYLQSFYFTLVAMSAYLAEFEFTIDC